MARRTARRTRLAVDDEAPVGHLGEAGDHVAAPRWAGGVEADEAGRRSHGTTAAASVTHAAGSRRRKRRLGADRRCDRCGALEQQQRVMVARQVKKGKNAEVAAPEQPAVARP